MIPRPAAHSQAATDWDWSAAIYCASWLDSSLNGPRSAHRTEQLVERLLDFAVVVMAGQRLMTGALKSCSFFGSGCPVSVANITPGMHAFVIRNMPARSDEHGLVKRTTGMLPTGKLMMGNDTGVAKTCHANWSMPSTCFHSGCRFNDREPDEKNEQ
jgi:hypothetical protein